MLPPTNPDSMMPSCLDRKQSSVGIQRVSAILSCSTFTTDEDVCVYLVHVATVLQDIIPYTADLDIFVPREGILAACCELFLKLDDGAAPETVGSLGS